MLNNVEVLSNLGPNPESVGHAAWFPFENPGVFSPK